MKLLHTSDWHLGRSLYGRKRYAEYTAFLDWLSDTIEREEVDILLAAGDIFDTSTPGNRAQELYYRFLCRTSASRCRHIVIIAGNHDSPSFLNAPKELLRAMNVYVTGAATDDIEDEVFLLKNSEGKAEAIVCAVPYLRDKDIRSVEAGESPEDKSRKLLEGIQQHYHSVCRRAEELRREHEKKQDRKIPILAMGHLFTAGGQTTEGDGVRELYIGSLAHVSTSIFPESIDYLALGHLHVPQQAGGQRHIRYSGSPLPIGFGEADQKKQVVLVDFNKEGNLNIQEREVPGFQELRRIKGTLEEILQEIEKLKNQDSSAWLEIEYTGSRIVPDLRTPIEESIESSRMEIRRIRNKYVVDALVSSIREEELLSDLEPDEVFDRCLDHFDIPETDRPGLIHAYGEILENLRQEDLKAE